MLTIGIVVYNEEKNLHLIESNIRLLLASDVSYPCQLMIIDNASTDKTLQKLQLMQSRYSFILRSRRFNHMGQAREDVLQMAQTEWVGFVDADCLLSQTWKKEVFHIISNLHEGTIAFGGPLAPGGGRSELYQSLFSTFAGSLNSSQVKLFKHSRFVDHLPTANVIYHKPSIIGVGGFSPYFQFVGEDLELSYRILKSKKKILICPCMTIQHFLPVNILDWLKKSFKYGSGRGRVSIFHSDYLSPQFLIPWFFSIFLILNAIFLRQLYLLPVLVLLSLFYFIHLSPFSNSRKTNDVSRVVFWMFLTQIFYSAGVLNGTCEAIINHIKSTHSQLLTSDS